MTFPLDWNAGWVVGLMHHLWQSTMVCVSLWLLSLMLSRNLARMRFRLWMLASIKFLLPFSLLITAGEAISARKQTAPPSVAPVFSIMIEGPASYSTVVKPQHAAEPAGNKGPHADVAPTIRQSILQYALLLVWTAGSLVVAFVWLRSWLRLRSMVRRGTQVGDIAGLHAVIVVSGAEPGVFGIVRPVLMLPEGVTRNLSAAQMEAIVAHELCHVRRRDNLWAALHMMVSVIFWFHPLVWWIGRQLIAEREATCDEAVLDQSHSATEYAEGILNICKFYLEVPVACFSGVTGADLKKRIGHILSGSAAERLSMGRKLILSAAGVLSIGLPLTFGLLHASRSYAQAPAKTNPDDTWQGTLQTPQKGLRTVLKITRTADGKLSALFYSIDQGGQPIPVKETTFQNGELALNVEAVDGVYKGKMSPDGTTITGEWKQGDRPLPLILVRATPDTAWAIPEPPPKLPPMAVDADPSFEVATIKPTAPEFKGKGFGGPPRHFGTRGTTLEDIMSFVYGVNPKQIVGAPDWAGTERFDITTGEPDVPGAPSQKQQKLMLRKVVEARFGLKFHKDQKEMSAYVLGVVKDGPKMTKSTADPNSPPAFFFTKLGHLTVRNATMLDVVNGFQGAVFDRPVVDHTGIEGHWDFSLKWTPDETQFQVFGVKIVPDESADAPPPIFTAIQEQVGLKLDAAKTMVDVMVLDHVEKPSEN